jgi:hypothetical protein
MGSGPAGPTRDTVVNDVAADILALLDAASSEGDFLVALAGRIRAFQPFDRGALVPDVTREDGIDLDLAPRVVELAGARPLMERGDAIRFDTRADLPALREFAGRETASLLIVVTPERGAGADSTERSALVLASRARWAFPAAPLRRLRTLADAAARLRPHISEERREDAAHLFAEISKLSAENSALRIEIEALRRKKKR